MSFSNGEGHPEMLLSFWPPDETHRDPSESLWRWRTSYYRVLLLQPVSCTLAAARAGWLWAEASTLRSRTGSLGRHIWVQGAGPAAAAGPARLAGRERSKPRSLGSAAPACTQHRPAHPPSTRTRAQRAHARRLGGARRRGRWLRQAAHPAAAAPASQVSPQRGRAGEG